MSAMSVETLSTPLACTDASRMAAIVEASDDAILSGNLDGIVETWNSGAERLYGYTAQEIVGTHISRLRADSEEPVADVIARIVRGETIRESDARRRTKDGRLLHVSIALSPLRDDAGVVTGISAITRDLTARKRVEQNLREAQERFAGAFDNASIGMAIVSPDGHFLSVNRALCTLLGRTGEELFGTDFAEITHPEDLAADRELLSQTVNGERDAYELEKRYLRPDGTLVWALLSVSAVRGTDGTPRYFVSQIQDITARKSAEGHLRTYTAHLTDISLRDPVTGMLNARGGEAALGRALAAGPGSIVLLRLDAPGALPVLAEAAQELCRDEDTPAVVAPCEVAVVLGGLPRGAAAGVAQRILVAVNSARPDAAVTHGVASWKANGTSARQVLQRARRTVDRADASRAAAATTPSSRRIDAILEMAREQLGMDMAFLGELTDSEEVFHGVAGDAASFGLAVGDTIPRAGSFCTRMIDGRIGNVVGDAAAEPEVADLPVTAAARVGAYVGVPLVLADGRPYGALCALNHSARADLGERDVALLRFLAGLIVEILESERQEEHDRRAGSELAGVHALLAALEARDHYTGEHSKTVVALAVAVAERLGLSPGDLHEVDQVALLHDIGKVGIPDSILQKQGPLDEAEWELMRQHPVIGERVIAGTASLAHLAPAIRAEHERWDGRGYPDGLRGEQIPLASRIGLACDAYHAMTSDRPYRPALDEQKAQAELRACAGSQFDPAVVVALLAVLGGNSQA